jgi:copper homeostasis protein
MVIHTTFSFTHVRPRKKENRRLGIWKTCPGFLEGKTITSGSLWMRRKGWRAKLEKGKGKMEKRAMGGRLVLEISVESVERAVAAERGGAARIELCGALDVGGITPGVELMRAARGAVRVPIFAMVRPRGGNFVYSAAEFEEMNRSIDAARAVGMDGVVMGILKRDGTVDVSRTADLVRAAAPLPVTFHRAFDQSADLFAGLEDVVATGVRRLLTSGGAVTAPEAVARIAELVRRAGGRVIVMPGSGITAGNVAEIAAATGAAEFHAGLSSVVGRDAEAAVFEREVRRMVAGLG